MAMLRQEPRATLPPPDLFSELTRGLRNPVFMAQWARTFNAQYHAHTGDSDPQSALFLTMLLVGQEPPREEGLNLWARSFVPAMERDLHGHRTTIMARLVKLMARAVGLGPDDQHLCVDYWNTYHAFFDSTHLWHAVAAACIHRGIQRRFLQVQVLPQNLFHGLRTTPLRQTFTQGELASHFHLDLYDELRPCFARLPLPPRFPIGLRWTMP